MLSLCSTVLRPSSCALFAVVLNPVAIMRTSISSFAFLSLLCAVKGELHQLIIGTFGTEKLYTLEFDDSALTLELIGNLNTSAASSWIALSVSISENNC